MRYLITGATGFIGGRLARRLVEDGHTVQALVRSPERARSLEELGVRLFRGDVTDRSTLPDAVRGTDGVFHLAGWYEVGVRDRSPGYRVNVEGTRNVLGVMRELDTPKAVYTSTLAVFSNTNGRIPDERYRFDGSHLSEYDRTKWIAHYEVARPMMDDGLPLVMLQPGLVYGPGDRTRIGDAIRDYLQRRLPILVKESAFCWGYIDDIVRVHVAAMDRGQTGETYIVGGPIHTLIEAFEIAERITGIPAPKLRLAPWHLRVLAGLARPAAVVLPPVYSPETLRVAAGSTYLGDDAKARRELGFDPRPLEEGLRETLSCEMKVLGIAP